MQLSKNTDTRTQNREHNFMNSKEGIANFQVSASQFVTDCLFALPEPVIILQKLYHAIHSTDTQPTKSSRTKSCRCVFVCIGPN